MNITNKIGAGRNPASKKKFFDALFVLLREHFESVFDSRSFALSMYIEEADESGSYKFNNIHARLKSERPVRDGIQR